MIQFLEILTYWILETNHALSSCACVCAHSCVLVFAEIVWSARFREVSLCSIHFLHFCIAICLFKLYFLWCLNLKLFFFRVQLKTVKISAETSTLHLKHHVKSQIPVRNSNKFTDHYTFKFWNKNKGLLLGSLVTLVV